MPADEKDAEIRAYAQEELDNLKRGSAAWRKNSKFCPAEDPNHENDVILEIRAGTGGDEATLFAAEMFKCTPGTRKLGLEGGNALYFRFSVGGLKEVIAIIEGQRVFSIDSSMRRWSSSGAVCDSHLYRQGRVHTSACVRLLCCPRP